MLSNKVYIRKEKIMKIAIQSRQDETRQGPARIRLKASRVCIRPVPGPYRIREHTPVRGLVNRETIRTRAAGFGLRLSAGQSILVEVLDSNPVHRCSSCGRSRRLDEPHVVC